MEQKGRETSMTVGKILRTWVGDHGYDGLYEPRIECGCRLKDLMPCDGAQESCKPGYLMMGQDDVWMIGPDRGTSEQLRKINADDQELERLRVERGGH